MQSTQGGKLGRGETKGAAAKHGGSEAVHDRLDLDVEVTIHLVRAPPAEQSDPVAVNTGAEEGHCPACASRAGGDVGHCVGRVRMEGQRGADTSGQVRGEDVSERCAGSQTHSVKRRGGQGAIAAQGENACRC